MSSQKNVLEVILKSTRSVFNLQSLRMLTECENSQKLFSAFPLIAKQ